MNNNKMNTDPILEFTKWHRFAHEHGEVDPDAMALATATKNAKPSVRIVLFKGIQQGNFIIYSNYKSRKARELAENPQAAVTFYWAKYYRQIRVEGLISQLSPAESDAYFASRPRESQLAAWASEQSQQVSGRDYLLQRYGEYENRFQDKAIPRPDNWGGYCLVPELIEFWQGLDHRLHDRFCYRRQGECWEITHLAP